MSEWADRYRMLSSRAAAEPGRYRTRRTPYMKEIMDALSPGHPAQRVVFMKAAQVGATEAGNCFLGFIIHQAPGPALAVQPTVELAKRNSRQRIDPLIEESAGAPGQGETGALARRRQHHAVEGFNRASPVSGPTYVDATVAGKRLRRGARLWTVAVSTFKAETYRFLRLERPTDEELAGGARVPPGTIHLPDWVESEWLKQFVAEQLVTVKTRRGFARLEWQKLRERNEALDTRVYARAAAWIAGLDRWSEERWAEAEREVSVEHEPAGGPRPPIAPARRIGHARRLARPPPRLAAIECRAPRQTPVPGERSCSQSLPPMVGPKLVGGETYGAMEEQAATALASEHRVPRSPPPARFPRPAALRVPPDRSPRRAPARAQPNAATTQSSHAATSEPPAAGAAREPTTCRRLRAPSSSWNSPVDA